MDVLPRITRQIIELFRQMSPLTRAMSVAVTAAVLFAFGYLLIWNPPGRLLPVASGRSFDQEEISAAEHALRTAGLTRFRRDGQRLLAPAEDMNRYNAVLTQLAEQPTDLGSQMLKQYENLGPFSTERQRQQMKEALLLQELRQTIRSVPDIEDARVAIATSERRLSWNEKPRTTANVSIKLRVGREITTSLVSSLKQVVANMVADMKPADVTIFDISRGQAYSGGPGDETFASRYQRRAREFARQYERQIEKALSYIPNLRANIQVDLENLQSESDRILNTQSNIEDETDGRNQDEITAHQTAFRGSNAEQRDESFLEAFPKSVQVSVSIPREYLHQVLTHRASQRARSSDRLNAEQIEEEVLTKVERVVERMVPADVPPTAISVAFVDPIVKTSNPTSHLIDREQLSRFFSQWGGALAITLIALVALTIPRLLTKPATSLPIIEEPVVSQLDEPELSAPASEAEPVLEISEAPSDRMAVLRGEIRSLVKTDPSAAASILDRWLSEVAA